MATRRPTPPAQSYDLGTAGLPQWLTRREASDFLKVCSKTLSRWIAQGVLPVVRLSNGPRARIRIARAALEAFIAARQA